MIQKEEDIRAKLEELEEELKTKRTGKDASDYNKGLSTMIMVLKWVLVE